MWQRKKKAPEQDWPSEGSVEDWPYGVIVEDGPVKVPVEDWPFEVVVDDGPLEGEAFVLQPSEGGQVSFTLKDGRVAVYRFFKEGIWGLYLVRIDPADDPAE
jgi:hypothetical protein